MQSFWTGFVSIMYKFKDIFDLTSPIRYIIFIIDILIVTFIIY